MFRNTWNIVIEWFKDRSERSRLVRNFNQVCHAGKVRINISFPLG